ncbi:MAG: extracellular solute-binding protein [Sphaerochaetaceae bacterium]|nr:extracellular solute-binding protein [Spirochaetales bacterium]MDY5500344.1 extracellular solute-binding protein [Sphaerochaetaceae bacterium]
MARILLACALVAALGGCKGRHQSVLFDAKHPVSLSLWTYYSGKQLDSFNDSVRTFNEGKGRKLGIQVVVSSPGSLNDLQNALIASAQKEVGSSEIPNMFATYPDIARVMDSMGTTADLSSYLTEEEKHSYIDGYISEGEIGKPGELKVFPFVKSTEVLILNETDWNKFASATGAKTSDFSTIEGLVDVARRYYEWTDSLTETPDDGKAFFGRDAMANYMIIGMKQLGMEIIQQNPDGSCNLTFDEHIVRELWDNYYVPYINGYFSSMGRFRSDDMKTGNIIAYVGSSSGVAFAPNKVTLEDGSTYPITTQVFQAPAFEDGKAVAVQQGAGIAVTKASEAEIQASVEFLKWFTQPEQNMRFAMSVGYMPVTKAAMQMQELPDVQTTPIILETLKVSMETALTHEMYTPKPVENGTKIRQILEESLSGQAVADQQRIAELEKSGLSRRDAVARFDTDEHFRSWYEETLKELEALT